MKDDYYSILGVGKNAGNGEIKAKYRKLAKKYHPDKNPGDEASEQMFKKVSEAYAVLSDHDKRKNYDMFGSDKFHQRFSQEDIFRGTNLNDILREMGFGDILGFSGGFGGRRARGEDIFSGAPFGGQTAPAADLDILTEMTISLEESAKGGQRQFSLKSDRGMETISIKIPAGVNEGSRLRLAGKGRQFGRQKGNLYINIHIAPHPYFKRDGDDLIMKMEINVSTALLGGSVDVKTLEGVRSVKIPAGTRSGQKIRIKGHGVKRMKRGGAGDLYLEIGIRVPEKLTPEQKKIAEKLKKEGL
jgi:curved DNA-binding protein